MPDCLSLVLTLELYKLAGEDVLCDESGLVASIVGLAVLTGGECDCKVIASLKVER